MGARSRSGHFTTSFHCTLVDATHFAFCLLTTDYLLDTYWSVHITGPRKPSDPIISGFQFRQALSVEDPTVVSSIVNEGSIPLITVSRNDGTVRVACLRSQSSKSPLKWAQYLSSKLRMNMLTTGKQWVPKSRYVAISHV